MCAASLKDDEVGFQSEEEEAMGGAPRLTAVYLTFNVC